MSDDRNAGVKEVRQSFRPEIPSGDLPAVKRYRAKVFKSGNSLALRLPAGLGLEAGMEMALQVEEGGRYTLTRPDAPSRNIDVSGFAGKAPWLKPIPRDDFEDSPRDWHLLDRASDGSES